MEIVEAAYLLVFLSDYTLQNNLYLPSSAFVKLMGQTSYNTWFKTKLITSNFSVTYKLF